ncbi:MAG: DUF1549 domain-containing protein [Verrucomicrobiales bacterium]|nr:DUF1549 domain-containing protein [Verrucomicrobiales bacterium]
MSQFPKVILFLVFSTQWLAAEVDFAHQIVPVLKEKCAKCHMEDNKKGGFSMNTRAAILEGSENGRVVTPGDGAGSYLYEAVTTDDPDLLMPPKGERLTAAEAELLKQWIDEKLPWQAGFTFGEESYEPPLKHRPVDIPKIEGPEIYNDIDRLVADYFKSHQNEFPPLVSDEVFIRRVYLDLIGLLPDTEKLESFLADNSPDKRARLIESLLADGVNYTAHWLTFWNDLLRNAYRGTGFIDGGRKPITDWLIPTLKENIPYDDMVRQLVSPTTDSEGFINGIKWRGDVNASQTREVQFSQNIGQAFLGINMKCASCHDSFVDRWKLDEAYNLAAIIATEPIEIHRCDKATGKFATAAWIFPELGNIDAGADKKVRLQQLSELLVHPDNGRTTRTMANRIWHRLLGRGIVHPVDAMDTEPWSEPLLDHLANYFKEQGYDLKALMAYIANSRIYQSRSMVIEDESFLNDGYTFAGPVARRMAAEQYVDAIEQIGGVITGSSRAVPVHIPRAEIKSVESKIRWLELFDLKKATPADKKAGYRIRAQFDVSPKDLTEPQIFAQVNTGLSDQVKINGKPVSDLKTGKIIDIKTYLKPGQNDLEILFPAKSRAYYIWNAFVKSGDDFLLHSGAIGHWEWARGVGGEPEWKKPRFLNSSGHPAARQISRINPGPAKIRDEILRKKYPNLHIARASLRDNDLLQRALGRPNREQIVSMRENRLTMLQAMDLSNGESFSKLLNRSAENLINTLSKHPDEVITSVYEKSLSRAPSDLEREISRDIIGQKMSRESLQDFLWNIVMLPEFQIVQ